MHRGATQRDVVVRRVAPDGSLPYGANGVVVCNASGNQTLPRLLLGASNSYYVTWVDTRVDSSFYRDLYVQRLTQAGSSLFLPNGIPINSAAQRAGEAYGLEGLCSDGAGSAIMLWQTNGIVTGRVQRLSSSGALQWGANGLPVGTSNRFPREIRADGSGGFWGTIRDAVNDQGASCT